MALQVKINDSWQWVFCQCNGKVITTPLKRQALFARDLLYFTTKHSDQEFRVANTLYDLPPITAADVAARSASIPCAR